MAWSWMKFYKKCIKSNIILFFSDIIPIINLLNRNNIFKTIGYFIRTRPYNFSRSVVRLGKIEMQQSLWTQLKPNWLMIKFGTNILYWSLFIFKSQINEHVEF